jgi:hypothetical protein
MKIASWRAYGGYELEVPGLTCSVYPAYTPHSIKGSAPPLTRQKSIELTPYTLGQRTDASFSYEGKYTLIIELSLQDPALGTTTTLSYDLLTMVDGLPPLTPHGMNYAYHEGTALNLSDTTLEDTQPLSIPDLGMQKTFHQLDIRVSPGEELLREWMELIRLALDDMPTIRPFTVRSSTVKAIDFPTSAWTRQATDLLFHSSYLVWELILFPPASWKDIYFIPASDINVNLPTEKDEVVL